MPYAASSARTWPARATRRSTPASAARDRRRAAASASIPVSSGTVPAGRRSHSARSAARPRARAADSGYGERRDRRRVDQQRGRRPARLTNDAEHRLLVLARRPTARTTASADLVRLGDDRRHEQDDHARRRPGRRARAEAPPRRSSPVAEPSMSTGLARLASRGRISASAARVSSASGGELEPGRLAGVGAEDPEAAGVGDAPRRGGRAEAAGVESSAATSTSSSSVSARITPAWRKSASTAVVRAGERSGVRAGGPRPGAGRGRPSSPGSASCARRGARGGANLRGLPNDSR